MQISFAVTAKLISAFVFAQIVQFLFFLNLKFQASNLLLILYSPVCVRPGWNPNCLFSHAQAHFAVHVTAKLINIFVFTTRIVQFLFFLNPKFPASSHLLCLCQTCSETTLLVFLITWLIYTSHWLFGDNQPN